MNWEYATDLNNKKKPTRTTPPRDNDTYTHSSIKLVQKPKASVIYVETCSPKLGHNWSTRALSLWINIAISNLNFDNPLALFSVALVLPLRSTNRHCHTNTLHYRQIKFTLFCQTRISVWHSLLQLLGVSHTEHSSSIKRRWSRLQVIHDTLYASQNLQTQFHR